MSSLKKKIFIILFVIYPGHSTSLAETYRCEGGVYTDIPRDNAGCKSIKSGKAFDSRQPAGISSNNTARKLKATLTKMEEDFCSKQSTVFAHWTTDAKTNLSNSEEEFEKLQTKGYSNAYPGTGGKLAARANYLLDKPLTHAEIRSDLYATCIKLISN